MNKAELRELERKLDEALEGETPEGLKEWIDSKRSNPPQVEVTDEDIQSKLNEIRPQLSSDYPLAAINDDLVRRNIMEMAFCASPFHDFDNCPLIKQTNDCKECRWYEDGTK